MNEKIIQKEAKVMKSSWGKKHVKIKKTTKTMNIYLNKLKIIQKTFTFKKSQKSVRTILRKPGKYLKKWLVNPKSKRLFFKLLDYQQIRGN